MNKNCKYSPCCEVHKNENYMQSPCCQAHIRAEVSQSCRIFINNSDNWGYIEDTEDFTCAEVLRETAYCETCGEQVNINSKD